MKFGLRRGKTNASAGSLARSEAAASSSDDTAAVAGDSLPSSTPNGVSATSLQLDGSNHNVNSSATASDAPVTPTSTRAAVTFSSSHSPGGGASGYRHASTSSASSSSSSPLQSVSSIAVRSAAYYPSLRGAQIPEDVTVTLDGSALGTSSAAETDRPSSTSTKRGGGGGGGGEGAAAIRTPSPRSSASSQRTMAVSGSRSASASAAAGGTNASPSSNSRTTTAANASASLSFVPLSTYGGRNSSGRNSSESPTTPPSGQQLPLFGRPSKKSSLEDELPDSVLQQQEQHSAWATNAAASSATASTTSLQPTSATSLASSSSSKRGSGPKSSLLDSDSDDDDDDNNDRKPAAVTLAELTAATSPGRGRLPQSPGANSPFPIMAPYGSGSALPSGAMFAPEKESDIAGTTEAPAPHQRQVSFARLTPVQEDGPGEGTSALRYRGERRSGQTSPPPPSSSYATSAASSTQVDVEEAKDYARDLRQLCASASDPDAEAVHMLMSICQSYRDNVVHVLQSSDDMDGFPMLCDLNELLNDAIRIGDEASKRLGSGQDATSSVARSESRNSMVPAPLGGRVQSNSGSTASLTVLRQTVTTDSIPSGSVNSATSVSLAGGVANADPLGGSADSAAPSLHRSQSVDSSSTAQQASSPTSHARATSSTATLNVSTMVANQDIFSLICMLRAQQSERRLDAAYALMKFAQDDENVALRREILSSGGLNSFLPLFRSPGTPYETKIVLALAVSYLLPVVDKLSVSMSVKVVDCLRALNNARRISPNGHVITEEECRQAAAKGVLHFWMNHLEPMVSLSSRVEDSEGQKNDASVVPNGERHLLSISRGISGANRMRSSRSISAQGSGESGAGLFDQRRESIELTELLETTVSLIVRTAEPATSDGTPLPPLQGTYTLVEAVCCVEAARPTAVREGILRTLVSWIKSRDRDKVAPAASALRYLTSIKDSYMAGWIHSQMVNEKALESIVRLVQDVDADRRVVGNDVQLYISQILSSLCVAPHTRAAVEQADGVTLLIQFLGEYEYQPSQTGALHAGNALIQLASGAITRATVFGDDNLDSSGPGNQVVDAIIDQGGIEYFVNITRMERGKLRSMAVEALRVLSEDLSPSRQTRAELCYHGAAEALGLALSDGVESSRKQPSNDASTPRLVDLGQLKDIHESLSALANVLDPLPEGVSVGYHLKSDGRDIHKLLLEGCRQTTSSGGLSALLFIASLRFVPTEGAKLENIHIDTMLLLEEACRSLASVSPLLLSRQLAASGYAKWTDDVLISLGMVANQLERCENLAENVEDSILEIQVNVLRCLGALARYEPLKTRIVDRLLPFLLKMNTARDGGESSNAANQAFQALGLSDDEIAVQVSGNNAQLLADWFCLKRSCEIQAMARDEIRILLKNIWREPLREGSGNVAITQLNRVGSERSDVSSGTCSDLFEIALNDSESSCSKALEDIVRQYKEVYGCSEPRPTPDAEAGSESLLVEQSFPMDSTENERNWILAHDSALRGKGAFMVRPTPHVEELLRRIFPSTLIRDHVAPWNNLRPKSSFQFRGFMMPKRRYFSFRREGQLLSRLCQMESALCESNDVHWTLGFLNSSFAGEFSESLVQALYMCPMIIGLSFSQTGAIAGADDPEVNIDDGGSAMVSSLVGSLPPWIFSLTFDGLLNDRVMKSLVKVLETMGRLTAGHTDQLSSILQSSRRKGDQSQGRFSYLAVRRSPKIQKDSWKSFFRLLGHTEVGGSKAAPRPLSTLKVLDLSGNKLGDDLCAAVLLLAHDKDSGCTLEEVDLSGNCIGDASSVLKVMREYVNQHRYQQHTGRATTKKRWKSHLHTLVLADNDLHSGRAWLEFLYMLKNDALELHVLDISNNGLVLGDHEDDLCDAAVSALLKSTSLRRLNLSKNAFSQRSLDHLLQALALATNDSVLSFLDIDDNVPSLSEQQRSLLASFLSRTRRNLVQRTVNAHKEVEVLSDSSAEIAPYSALVTVPAEQTVDASTSNADSSKQEKPELWENMITVLFSAPLVFFNDREIATPFEKLDFAMEREILWQCLKEASREIDLFFDNATADRLLTAISKRCTCLHYSGHGHPRYLPFENCGGPHWMDIETIRNMISTGEGAAFRFVFVSACHSYSMGATFASAGVPHVVCCDEGAALKDSAALQFTRHFYLSLAFGNTVKESFDQGCKAVRARHPESEMKKFRLLPENGNHDEPIFQGAGPRSSISGASKKGSHAVGTKALELSVQNKIQEDPGPSPPQFFLGREVDMYKVLQQLLDKQQRLVSVVGATGVGRSSLVKALSHYINERASTMLDIEHIYFVKAKQDSRRRKRSLALMRRLLQLLVDAGKITAPVQDPSDIETITDAACRALKNDKVLIVFDRVDLLDDAEEANEFPIALKTLLSETRNLKVLLTNRKPLGIPSITEKSYVLGPLSLGNTVHLFAQLCPYLHTIQERHKLMDALVKDLEQVDLLPTDPGLSPSTTKIFEFMGSGIPSQIEKAAYNVSKEMFLSMMSGSFLEEVGGSGTLVVDAEEVNR